MPVLSYFAFNLLRSRELVEIPCPRFIIKVRLARVLGNATNSETPSIDMIRNFERPIEPLITTAGRVGKIGFSTRAAEKPKAPRGRR